MAMDGSFSLESALERFLARCPKLQSSPKFVLLTIKGNAVTQDEVVKALVELFVHPNYTIPLMGCFRPIAQKIVDKAVELLRLVPNLRSNSDRGVVEVGKDRDLNEVENVIEFYSGAGRGLDLHELVCLAFCRALELAPFFWGSIVGYFEFAPPPFERILMGPKVSDLCVEVGTVFACGRGVLRLLLVKYGFSLNFRIGHVSWTLSSSLQILTCTIVLRYCGGHRRHKMMEEFCQDVSFESGGWYVESSRLKGLVSLDGRNVYCQKSCLQSSSQCYDIEPQTKRQSEGKFKMMLSAVKEKWPVLLYGPTGCGKSALISKLSQDSGNQVLSIHMDDQIDGRTLIGSYVCTEKPGEFRWQPGSLTQAVSNGYWVVFEDIDKAPSDVRSVILPLLEGVNLFATGHGQEIRVPESFRIFSTISTSKLDPSCIAEGGNSLSIFFKVYVSPSTNEDLQSIVKAWYPSLEPLAVKLTETFESINSATLRQTGGFQAGNSASVSYPSRFSLRDLLKWCKRITGLGFSFEGDDLSPYARDCIYQEAVDIFAAFSTSTKNRLTLMQYIARLWDVPSTVSDTLYPPNKPVVQDLLSDLRVGRVSLPRIHTTKRGKKDYKKKPFVEIRSSIHLLERIASSVKWNEPVLLVGETGTGKTTLVQDLAMRLGHKLTVLNLSQQSDVADLLGGYKPMDAKFIYLPLYNEFCDLFSKSFHVQLNPKFIGKLEDALKKEDWERLLKGFEVGVKKFFQKVEEARSLVEESGKKRKKAPVEEQIKAWENFTLKVENASAHGMIFSFVEGFCNCTEKW
ncbi:hypothetical protein Pyn_00932 [Prunus yedoensis var. nudiflora]|uniref:Midasin n=1 Tax=Prunus yedoensis var. nudiflora TaxID=2094558 RepID=A0A314XJI2_PRUYE|nr:hypothetical protein Pyn_00932 [Prunus yedoensis var. nudiflora]